MNRKIFAGLIFLFFSVCFPVSLFSENQQYVISGMVTNKGDDFPVRDAEIRISGDKETSERTDIFGYYHIEGLDAGSYIEVTAVKDGVTITPDIIRIASLNSDRTINFTAVLPKSAPAEASRPGKSPGASGDSVLPKPARGVSPIQPEYVA